LQSAIRDLDSGLPLFIETWNRRLDLVLIPSRVATAALGLLGGMGAMLSITGIFGMAAYSVSKRKRELGIRIALGAERREVLQAALGPCEFNLKSASPSIVTETANLNIRHGLTSDVWRLDTVESIGNQFSTVSNR